MDSRMCLHQVLPAPPWLSRAHLGPLWGLRKQTTVRHYYCTGSACSWGKMWCLKSIQSFSKSVFKGTQPTTTHSLLINFLLSSDAEIFASKHRLSVQTDVKNVQKRASNVRIFRLSFHFAYHLWWLGRLSTKHIAVLT